MPSTQNDEGKPPRTPANDEVETAIRQAERGQYAEAADTLAETIEGSSHPHSFHDLAAAISYYGLCVANLEHDLKRAIGLCGRAVRLEPTDARFHENLARVFLVAGNRRKALIAVEQGLRKLPANERLVRLRDSFGRRRSRVLGFLPRRHPINRFLGRVRFRLFG